MSTMSKMAVRAGLMAAMALPMSGAMASSLFGGGATFPAPAYLGVPGNLVTSPAPGSIFGTYVGFSGNTMSYCLTGSGAGKAIQTSGNASLACTTGFSAPAGRTLPNYIGTDSPYNLTEHTAFKAALGATKSSVVQVPSLVGVVVLPFHNVGVTTNIALQTNDVCNIFFGVYTNWNQIPALGLPSKAIHIVGRSDNSGTSFSFTNWAARNCNAAGGGPIAPDGSGNARIKTNQTYNLSGLRVDILAAGNPALVTAVYANDGAIGYGDPGDVFAVASHTYAKVNGLDPKVFTSPTLAGANLLTNTVVNGVNAVTGVPATASAGANIPTALTLVNPTLVAGAGKYPIIAFTYLDTYARQNNAANVGGDVNAFVALQGLLNCVSNATTGCRPTTLPAGYDYVRPDAAATTKINTAIAQILN